MLWALLVGTYALFWFGVAFAVNAVGRNSAANALGMLAIWLVFVVLAPAALNLAATARHPVPSRSN